MKDQEKDNLYGRGTECQDDGLKGGSPDKAETESSSGDDTGSEDVPGNDDEWDYDTEKRRYYERLYGEGVEELTGPYAAEEMYGQEGVQAEDGPEPGSTGLNAEYEASRGIGPDDVGDESGDEPSGTKDPVTENTLIGVASGDEAPGAEGQHGGEDTGTEGSDGGEVPGTEWMESDEDQGTGEADSDEVSDTDGTGTRLTDGSETTDTEEPGGGEAAGTRISGIGYDGTDDDEYADNDDEAEDVWAYDMEEPHFWEMWDISFILKCVLGAVIALVIIIFAFVFLKERRASRQAWEEYTINYEKAERLESRDGMELELKDNEPAAGASDFISAYDVKHGMARGEIVLDEHYLTDNAAFLSDKLNNMSVAKLSLSPVTAKETDILMLQFTAYTEESTVTMEVSADSQTTSIFLTKTPTVYCIPVTGVTRIEDITFSVTSEYYPTVVDAFSLVNYGDAYTIDRLMTGAWRQDERRVTELTADDSEAAPAVQILTGNGYLYALGDGALVSYRISGADGEIRDFGGADGMTEDDDEDLIAVISAGSPYDEEENIDGAPLLTEAGRTDGMGDVKDMAFTSDGTAIMVTAGQNGAYIIDITNPEEMTRIAHYDTLEDTSGICISGSYAFLASRYFGVEIVDISRKYSPTFINKVALGAEYSDCFVKDNYLYVGVNGQKRVDIYDIGKLGECVLTAQIETDGCAKGLFQENGTLYVATGRNSLNDASGVKQYGTGTGNGLEIYDVREPGNPVHISTVKANGRLSAAGSDIWDVQVSNGYAYVTDAANGLLVYDVRDQENPVCQEEYHIAASVPGNYDTATLAYSWDTTKEKNRASAYHTALTDGAIWLCSKEAGIFRLEAGYARRTRETETPQGASLAYTGTLREDVKSLELDNYKASVYTTDGPVWAAEIYDGLIYAACGEAGIQVLDSRLNLLGKVPGEGSVRDIKIYDGIMYTAEGSGIGIYKLSGIGSSEGGEVISRDGSEAENVYVIGSGEELLNAGDGSGCVTLADIEAAYGFELAAARAASYMGGDAGSGSVLDGLILVSRTAFYGLDPNVSCASQLELTSDGRYLVAQASGSMQLVLDVSDPYEPEVPEGYAEHVADSYPYRNIVTGHAEGIYAGIAGNTISWYTSEDGVLTRRVTRNPHNAEGGGLATFGNKVIQSSGNGYYYYSMDSIDEAGMDVKVKVTGLSGASKLSAAYQGGSDILVASASSAGEIMVLDITDIDSPRVLEQFEVKGNPDVAAIGESFILVPLRYSGLLKLAGQ